MDGAPDVEQAKQTLDGAASASRSLHALRLTCLNAVLFEMSTILNTGLDRESLATLVTLCENGVNPEALAAVVREIRREKAALEARRDE